MENNNSYTVVLNDSNVYIYDFISTNVERE